MRSLLLAATLSLSTAGYALADQCDVKFAGQLQLAQQQLSITTANKQQILIDQHKRLWVDGQLIALSDYQQELVSDYYTGYYIAAPKAAQIAADGVTLANVAVTEVFSELLGADNDAVTELSAKLTELNAMIQHNFYDEDGQIRLSSQSFDDGDFITHEWEEDFEQVVENIVENSIGSIMLNIGSELLFSGGDMDAFEAKMERFGNGIEQRVEYQSEALEARADALCLSLAILDDIEARLQTSVPELAELDVLQVSQNQQAM